MGAVKWLSESANLHSTTDKLFRTIFEQTPVSTQIFTPDGETYVVNKAWEKLWNVKFEQIGSYNILKDRQLIETGTMPYIKRGFKGEIVLLPAIKYDPSKVKKIKGMVKYRWLSARMYPIKDSEGRIIYVVLQHEDITERKSMEEHLKESEAKFRRLIESSKIIPWESDIKTGLFTYVGPQAEKVLGYPIKDWYKKNFWEKHIHHEDREWVIEYCMTSLAKKKDYEFEYRMVDKEGRPIWLRDIVSVTEENGKKLLRGFMLDITKQKLSDEALRNSEERLRLALDAGKIGVWDWEVKDNALTWTDSVYTIHGVDKKTFKPSFEGFKKLIHPEDRETTIRAIQDSLMNKTPYNLDFRIITPNGDTRWLTTRAMTYHDKSGKPLRMLGATSDITQQKQLEQDKNDFISMASHELKTPITSLKMFVDLLHKELKRIEAEKALYLTTRIQDQTGRMVELINDLLDVSRIETGKLQFNKAQFDLTELVKETVEGLQATTSHMIIVKAQEKVKVFADKYRIYQVLVNLITNAIKYSPDEDKIIIKLTCKDDNYVVSVQDYGIGIASDKQQKIFERLYQVTGATEKTYPGLGLGLYISREIVERHGGKIWVKSEKGKGSTFYFSLDLDRK